jgi:hypothetical protein
MDTNHDSRAGFPRPDGAVRDYLTGGTSQADVRDRATRFFMALFAWLQDFNPKTPSDLQNHLAYGDPLRFPERQKILAEIIAEAEDVSERQPV